MHFDQLLDTTGLQCPLPLLKAKKALSQLPVGAVLCVRATDPTSQKDFLAFTQLSTHKLLHMAAVDGVFIYYLEKG